jgi:hypothetical protein
MVDELRERGLFFILPDTVDLVVRATCRLTRFISRKTAESP